MFVMADRHLEFMLRKKFVAMDAEKPQAIESADVYDSGVIVTFSNGKFAFYSAPLLWSIFEKAAELAMGLSVG